MSRNITVLSSQSTSAREAATVFGNRPLNWAEVSGNLTPGMHIAAMVTFHQDNDGKTFMRVANASCSADAFLPTDLSAEDEAQLSQHVGTTATVTVTIGEVVGRHFCHGHKYTVAPQITLAPLPLNPDREALEHLAPKTQVVIEGVFAGYFNQNKPEDWKPEATRIGFYVETPSGRATILTHCSTDYDQQVTYADGVIENLRGKVMMEGDRIRFTAFVTETHILNGAYNYAYLLEPCEKRQAAYDQLRHDVAGQISTLKLDATNRRYRAVRLSFAQLRQLDLTHSEKQRIQNIMDRLPRHERSTSSSSHSTYEANQLEQAFGVNVESLNRAQFLTFAFEVVRGVRENPTDKETRADQSYLFGYLLFDSPVFTHQEKVSLLRASLAARFKRLENRADNHDDYWDDQWLLEQTIKYMSYVDDATLVKDIEQLIEYCIGSGYFARDENGQTVPCRRMGSVLHCAFDTIEEWKRRRVASVRITRRRVLKWRAQLLVKGLDDAWLLNKIGNVMACLK